MWFKFIIFIFILVFASCKQTENIPEGMVKATVIKYELDGCNWMLELESGQKLEPVNLEEKFQKINLPVYVSYIEEKKMMSICMAGKIVRITQIRER